MESGNNEALRSSSGSRVAEIEVVVGTTVVQAASSVADDPSTIPHPHEASMNTSKASQSSPPPTDAAVIESVATASTGKFANSQTTV